MRRPGLFATLLVAGAAVACSGPAEEAPPTSVVPSAGHGSLAYCLNEHGVSAGPAPTPGPPPGVDEATWHEAMAACSALAPGPSAG